MSNILTMVCKIRRAKRSTACQMDDYTDETDILQIFAVKYHLIYNSVGYDCIDMENILAGCFIYADDITLALNAMLIICELYAGEHILH